MKKRLSILAVLVLAITVTAYSVSGTYAKYTSGATGTSSARVAKWAFTVNTADITASNTFTFNLFDTLLDSDVTTAEGNVIAANGTDKIIAPGTSGKFDIKLANNSEVDATYSIDYTVENTANIPVEFSLNGTTWKSNINDLDATNVAIANNGGEATVTVYWRWAFEGTSSTNYTTSQTDTTDTALGITGTDTITVSAAVTATQVD